MKDETAQTISKPPVKTNPEPLPIVESPQPVKQTYLQTETKAEPLPK